MDAEHRPIDDSSKREIIEDFGEIMPGIDVAVFSEDFIVESVCLGGLSAFVVSSEECDALGVFCLQAQQVFNGLDWVMPSVNEVSNENVLVLRKITSFAEKF